MRALRSHLLREHGVVHLDELVEVGVLWAVGFRVDYGHDRTAQAVEHYSKPAYRIEWGQRSVVPMRILTRRNQVTRRS